MFTRSYGTGKLIGDKSKSVGGGVLGLGSGVWVSFAEDDTQCCALYAQVDEWGV